MAKLIQAKNSHGVWHIVDERFKRGEDGGYSA